jgi:ATP-dependent DNA helicase RecG
MIIDDVNTLLKKGEGIRIEYKEGLDSVPKSFYETVSSFSNTDGGTILLGVNDSGVVLGVNDTSVSKIKSDLVTSLNSRDCIDPPLYVQPIEIRHPDGVILAVQIQSSSQVHNHAGKVFIRDHESDIDISGNQHKLSELYIRKRNFFTEAQIYPYLTIDDLDSNLFDKARQLIRNYKSDHPWLLVSNEQMLKDSVLWKKDFNSNQEGLTLACALIFGKETTIQSLLPAYKVEAMVRRENQDRWDDRITLRKNLIDTYLELKMFINRHLPEKFYVENDQRVDLRDKIFREVIGNVIVHREYTSALSTDLIIGQNEVFITNPNRALFHGSIDALSFNPFPKNPNIRKFFTAFGWTDEIGSGIRNTNKYLPLYANNAKPVFIEDDTFKTIIPLQSASLMDYTDHFHSWLELPKKSAAHLTKSLSFISLPGSLNKASWNDIVLHLVSSWSRQGIQLAPLNWPEKQAITMEALKKVPSWNKKSTQLLHKKARYYMSILILAAEPVKLKELMEWLDYKNEKTFRDNYMKPLRESGLISFTNPENPTMPDNRYKTTVTGIHFIAGRDIVNDR